MQPNKDYPPELQPRLRDRAASRTQVDNIARNLNPKVLLHDTGFIDTGAMIVGADNVVESGNGRVLALRKAVEEYPEKYRLYKVMFINQANKYGLSDDDIEAIDNPVLVRERITKVDRAEFARQANVGAIMGMSPYERANQDAKQLSAEAVSQIQVGENQTMDQALRMKANDSIVNSFVKTIPANERATVSDEKGMINLQGINRLKLALFAKTYTGEAGQRLTRIFGESADPYVKQIENTMFQSLPDMAKAEGLIADGKRESNLSIAPDLAEVVDTYAGIKANGLSVKVYLDQSAMFEERLSPYQKDILRHFDTIARKSKLLREFIRDSAQGIINAPIKGQIAMMGSDPITKESITYGIINRQRKELGESPIVYQPAATGKELEKPHTRRIRSTKAMARKPEKDKEISKKVRATTKPKKKATPMTELREINQRRSLRAQAQDLRRKHRYTITPKDKARLLQWARNQGQADVIGIDSPPSAVKRTKPSPKRRRATETPRETMKTTTKIRQPRKGYTPISELRKRSQRRTQQAQTLDINQRHGVTISPRDKAGVRNWAKDMGSADVLGVDSPPSVTKPTRLPSRGRSRITPKRPRIT